MLHVRVSCPLEVNLIELFEYNMLFYLKIIHAFKCVKLKAWCQCKSLC